MKITRDDEGGVAVLALHGRLAGGDDRACLTSAVTDLVGEKASRVLIDLTDVPWMNSAGVGILVSAFTRLRTAGAHVRLLNLNERVRSILAISKLLHAFESYGSRAEALASFSSPGPPAP